MMRWGDAPERVEGAGRLDAALSPRILLRSQRDMVVDALLRAVAAGHLDPGEQLTVSTLATELGVAAATMREALGVLKALNLLEERSNRPSRIVTPTAKWYVARVAECAGISAVAVDLGVAFATTEERQAFADLATRARDVWAGEGVEQFTAAGVVWDLFQFLADSSQNRYIAELHAEKRHALAFGMKHLTQPRKPATIISAVEGLSVAVAGGDRDEGVEIVRDLYAYVLLPFVEA